MDQRYADGKSENVTTAEAPPIEGVGGAEADERMVNAALRGAWRQLDDLDLGRYLIDGAGAMRILRVQRSRVTRMAADKRWEPLFAHVGRSGRPSGQPHGNRYFAHRVAIAAYLRDRHPMQSGHTAFEGIEDDIRAALEYPDHVVAGARRYLARLAATPARPATGTNGRTSED